MKFLKWTALIMLTFLILVIGALTWVYNNPGPAFGLVQKYILPQDLKISWQKLEMQAERQRGLDFKLNWLIDGLLVEMTKPFVRAPIETIRLKADIDIFKRKFVVDSLQVLTTEPIQYRASQHSLKPITQNFFQQLQSVVQALVAVRHRVTYDDVKVQLKDFSLLAEQAGAPGLYIAGNFSSTEKNGPLILDAKVSKGGNSPMAGLVKGRLDLQAIDTDRPFLNSVLEFKGFSVDLKQNIEAIYNNESATINLKGDLLYSADQLKIVAVAITSLILKSSVAELQIQSEVKGIPGLIPKVNNLKARLTVPIEENEAWSQKASDITVDIPIELDFIEPGLRENLQKSCGCRLPLRIMGNVVGQIWISKMLDDSQSKSKVFDAKVDLESLTNKLFSIDLAASLIIEKEKAAWKFYPKLDCGATISRFRGFAPLFEKYKILLPAPLDILDGSVKFESRGPMGYEEKGSEFPARLEVNLASPNQKVKLDTDAVVSASRDFKKIHVQTKTKIEDFQVELPPLSPVKGNPRIISDSRIIKTPPKVQPSKVEVTFDIQVETVGNGAIRLLSQYFKPYLPVTLKVQVVPGKGNDGFIRTEPFQISYLRRNVLVEKLNLDLTHMDDEVLPIDARLKIQQTAYTVYIDVQGNAKSPNVKLSSEPELPESEIISVLLYDRLSSELGANDAETAGGVRAAVADRAIGLFGLWAFASTPIKSFSYNPATKVYTATVALSKDVTAGIGTTWESTAQLELRKRISKRWVLTAKWTGATDEEQQSTKMVLQWEKRF